MAFFHFHQDIHNFPQTLIRYHAQSFVREGKPEKVRTAPCFLEREMALCNWRKTGAVVFSGLLFFGSFGYAELANENSLFRWRGFVIRAFARFFWRSKRTEEGFSLMSSPKANEHYFKKKGAPFDTLLYGEVFYFTRIGLPSPAFSSSLSWVFASPTTT
jgi:hypothetical protein